MPVFGGRMSDPRWLLAASVVLGLGTAVWLLTQPIGTNPFALPTVAAWAWNWVVLTRADQNMSRSDEEE